MGRRKLVRIKDLDIAKARLSAIKSIDPSFDLGNGLTAVNYAASINSFGTVLNQYNTTLSLVDDLYNRCQENLQQIRDYSDRLLAGIGSKYGKNSNEYEMAGGTRKSERRKATAKKAVTA